ncbi:MAG: glucosamine-6-phosphate deaminase [Bacteroidota bacterium]
MQINISDTYDDMCQQVLAHLSLLTSNLTNPLICPASGSTPEGLYKQMVTLANSNLLDVATWDFVGLDEWLGMNETDEGSCRQSLDQQFFEPLQITENRICFFDGRATDPQGECEKVEAFINQHAGIDIAIVGLGTNGHVAMNEPGTNALLRSHISNIAPETQAVGQKYFSSPKKITQGITLGIATLMESRHILMMVNGIKKAAIVKEMLTIPVSEELPATLFRDHPGLHIYLDKEAASYLQTS